jgi:general secretion pathway protein C
MASVEAKSSDTLNLQNPALAPRRADIHKIMEAHLFGTVFVKGSSAETALPSAAANLLLTGTIATGNPKNGSAIVSDNGKSALYRVGAQVGGASVYSVYNDRIILDRGGRFEVLSLPHSRRVGAGSSEHIAKSAVVDASSARVGDAGNLADVMRIGATVSNESGQVRGFRIYPGKDRSAFMSAGLRTGDLVVAVNGASVLEQNRQDAQDAFKSIGHLPRATMTIERFGRTTDVTIDADQAGTSASTDPPAVKQDTTSVP